MRFRYAAILLTVLPVLAGNGGFDDRFSPARQLLPGRGLFARHVSSQMFLRRSFFLEHYYSLPVGPRVPSPP